MTDTTMRGIISSVLRFIEFVRTDIFSDPLWFDVNLLAYTIAEPGTIFIAACLVTYRPLLRRVFGTGYFSKILWKHRTDNPGDARPSRGIDDSRRVQMEQIQLEPKKQKRGFNSILLSAVSRDARMTTASEVALNKTDKSLNETTQTSNTDNSSTA